MALKWTDILDCCYFWCLCVHSGLFGRRTVRGSSLSLCLDCGWISTGRCTSLRPGQVTSAHTPAEWHRWAAMIPAARTYAWGQRWKPTSIILCALFPSHTVLHLFWSFLFDLFSPCSLDRILFSFSLPPFFYLIAQQLLSALLFFTFTFYLSNILLLNLSFFFCVMVMSLIDWCSNLIVILYSLIHFQYSHSLKTLLFYMSLYKERIKIKWYSVLNVYVAFTVADEML